MKEPSTYRALVEKWRNEAYQKGYLEGAITAARKALRIVGDDVFGTPASKTIAVLEGINDLTRLEGLLYRIWDAGSWQELLGQPITNRRIGRRQSWGRQRAKQLVGNTRLARRG
jgi:hypothetical protein